MHRIPGSEKIEIKKAFEERYRNILGKEYETFIDYSLSFLRRSIRVNTLKTDVASLKTKLMDKWRLEQIPWCEQGFWIEGERRDIGNLTEHMLGYFYVQEAASMIPPTVLAPEPGDIVLDMCAAPGSKTTQMAAMMQNKGCLIANDQKGLRLRALGLNLQRAGVLNTSITLMNGMSFKNKTVKFDKILLDAPCSGTGTIRRSLSTLQDWNPAAVKRLNGMQRHLIDSAFASLKPNGTLVYSTCSVEPEENEGTINYLIEQHPDAKIEKIKIDGKTSAPVEQFETVRYSPEVRKTIRIWPQDNNTDGFFIAKIKKE